MTVKLKLANGLTYDVPEEVAVAYVSLNTSIATDSQKHATALKTAQDSAAELKTKLEAEVTAHAATKLALDAAPEKYKKEARAAFDAYADTAKKAAKWLAADEMKACDEAGDETGLMKAALNKAKPGKKAAIEAADAATTKTMFDMLDEPADTEADSETPLSAEAKQRLQLEGGNGDKNQQANDRKDEPRGRAKFRARALSFSKAK